MKLALVHVARWLPASHMRIHRSPRSHRRRARPGLHRRCEAAVTGSPRAVAAMPVDDPKLEKIVERHCKAISDQLDEVPRALLRQGRAVVRRDRARRISPKTVVYPFGGGDLMSALVAFPDATEITTISLELAGDPRRLEKLDAERARAQPRRAARRDRRPDLGRLEHEREPLRPAAQRSARPGQLVPARARRRRLRAGVDALLHARRRRRRSTTSSRPRSTRSTRQALAHTPKSLKGDWQSPNFSTGVLERRDPVPQASARPRSACIATSAGTSATTT